MPVSHRINSWCRCNRFVFKLLSKLRFTKMTFSLIMTFVGGLGLFLLGMRLMTGGLSLAAGRHLRHILGKWTKTPIRGLFSGFLITALVQSSSAVTVAVIGFVNAGLLRLSHSVGVIYGSNVGTTTTGWIVAAMGLSVNIKALALPLVGLGTILHLTGKQTRREHFGDALAGFGLFFLGIEVLQSAFHGMESGIDVSSLTNLGGWSVPAFVLLGFALTFLMQASGAAMALVLTAALSGIIDVHTAAAAVIGTNIGTTSTAALSVLGATYNAKKVAAAHIIFNMVTGLLAVATLPLLLRLVDFIQAGLGFQDDPALALALFHTTFNIFGVLLFLPFSRRLVQFLDSRIGRKEMIRSKPKYLDKNVLTQPHLALDALFMELGRTGDMTRDLARAAIRSQFSHRGLKADKTVLDGLIIAIRIFCTKLQRAGLTENASRMLASGLRVTQYEMAVSEIIDELTRAPGKDVDTSGKVAAAEAMFQDTCIQLLNLADTPCMPEFLALENQLSDLKETYQVLKAALLEAGAVADLEMEAMAYRLEFFSRMRRMVEQAIKAVNYWVSMKDEHQACISRLHDYENVAV